MMRTRSPRHRSLASKADPHADLKDWLHKLGYPSRRICLQFSDGVEIATILKRMYTRLVDLPCFPKCTQYKDKLVNLELLNNKVLTRIGLPMDRKTMIDIARCEPGVVEDYLTKLVIQIQKNNDKDEKSPVESASEVSIEKCVQRENSDYVTVQVTREVDGRRELVDQEMIPVPLYENLKRVVKAKSTQVESLKKEVEFLKNRYDHVKNSIFGIFQGSPEGM